MLSFVSSFAGVNAADDGHYVLETHKSINKISAEEWDFLVGEDGSPFLAHEWIKCLEDSKCATQSRGWVPNHVTLHGPDNSLIAAAPMYIKYHSMGEFVFDDLWAESAFYAGIKYYPKLLCAVPFTPATGRRLLTRPELNRKDVLRIFAGALRKLTLKSGLSSMHVNFCEEDEAEALSRAGFLERKGVQYHFVNRPVDDFKARLYGCFDDYLASMKSKRRIQVKRERRSIYEDAGMNVQAYFGDEITDDMFPLIFQLYKTTIDKMFYGNQYLNKEFFNMLRKDFRKYLCIILAKRGNEVVAGTFNVVKNGYFYGRYWGCFYDVKNLHFETCYYKAIELCVDRGYHRMEPGAGGNDFKFLRGFDAHTTRSVHCFSDPRLHAAVGRYLDQEVTYVDNAVSNINERSVLRPRADDQPTPPTTSP